MALGCWIWCSERQAGPAAVPCPNDQQWGTTNLGASSARLNFMGFVDGQKTFSPDLFMPKMLRFE